MLGSDAFAVGGISFSCRTKHAARQDHPHPGFTLLHSHSFGGQYKRSVPSLPLPTPALTNEFHTRSLSHSPSSAAAPGRELVLVLRAGAELWRRDWWLLIKAASILLTSASKKLPKRLQLWATEKATHGERSSPLSWQAAGRGTFPPAQGYKLLAETRAHSHDPSAPPRIAKLFPGFPRAHE